MKKLFCDKCKRELQKDTGRTVEIKDTVNKDSIVYYTFDFCNDCFSKVLIYTGRDD